MKTYYNKNGIQIHHGDCRDVIRKLFYNSPEPAIDAVVSDVSYKLQSGGSGKPGDGSPSGILDKNDGKIFEYNDITTRDYAYLLHIILKDPSHCYIFINNDNLEFALRDFREAGFGLHNIITWDKGNCTPNGWGMKCTERILFFRKGKAFRINDQGTKDILRYSNPKSPKLHPCEKPVRLMHTLLVNSTQPGQTVLDPFCGSGATLVAALLSGRKAIGIDKDKKHCKVAVKQLEIVGRAIRLGYSTEEILRNLEQRTEVAMALQPRLI